MHKIVQSLRKEEYETSAQGEEFVKDECPNQIRQETPNKRRLKK
jgi:hypothetical protein